MKRTIEDIRANIDFVGCDNATALELCDEVERLLAGLTAARDALYTIATASHDYDPIWGHVKNAAIALGEERAG